MYNNTTIWSKAIRSFGRDVAGGTTTIDETYEM